MNQENCVIFKGTKNGISVLLEETADITLLKEQLNKKMEDASKFFRGAKTNITFKGKALTEKEEMELLKIISEKTNMNITFFQSESKQREAVPVLLAGQLQQHNLAKFYKGNVRSGQFLEFDGTVIIIGDVNPGAVVKASGNIIILGALKGIAHAGSNGMQDAFVSALTMVPVQLKIADIITRFPNAQNPKNKQKAEYAYIENGQIYVVPLE